MRGVRLLSWVLGSALVAAPAEAARPVVAVFAMDVDDRIGLAKPDRDALDELLHTQIASAGAFEVVPRDQVRQALLEEKKASYKACYADSCQIEVGAALAASKTVAGSIRKLGSKCTINLRLLDLRKETAEKAASFKGGCNVDGVVTTLEQAVGALVGPSAAEASKPADPPPPPVTRPETPPDRDPEPPVTLGSRSRSQVAMVFRRAKRAASLCYERARAKAPDLAGNVRVDVTIAADGRVTAARAEASEALRRAGVVKCMAGVARRLRFPPAEGVTRVRYPFRFSPR